MKFSNALLGVAAFTHGINAVATPAADAVALDNRAPELEFEAQSERSTNEKLWKRKGGGGGIGRGGGSSSSGGGRGSSSGSSRPPPNSPTSNTGGRTTTGSGPVPAYGNGNYYSGGARAPYGPGTTSSGIAPALLTGAALGGLGFVGYHYLYGAYSYPYTHHSYTFYNATTMMNETKPVVCLCDRYEPCTCEDNGDQAYFKSIVGNGTYDGLNMSIVTVKDTKAGQSTIYINGGVPNGTTASGGTDDPNAASGMMALAQAAGWWPAAAVAFATAFML